MPDQPGIYVAGIRALGQHGQEQLRAYPMLNLLFALWLLLLALTVFALIVRLLGRAPDQKRKRQAAEHLVVRQKTVRFDRPLQAIPPEADVRHQDAGEAVRQVRQDLARRPAAETEAESVWPLPKPATPGLSAAEAPQAKGLRLAAESTARRKAAEAELRAAGAAARPPATVAPPSRKAILEALPNGLWEGRLIDAPPVLLRYRDTKGAVSERVLLPQRARGPGTPGGSLSISAISGFCMMRKATRHFLVSGIVSAANPDTGELLDLSEMVSTHMEQR